MRLGRFASSGSNSLMSVTLANRLEAALGIKVSTVTLIQGPSIDELVDEFLPALMGSSDETVPEPIMLRPGDSAGTWPIAPDPTADDECPPQPIVIEPKASAGSWLIVVGPRAAPRLRLFCFPFAGGGSAVYRSWAQFIDPTIEVVAIEPPGRLGRITETPVADITSSSDSSFPRWENCWTGRSRSSAIVWAP